MKKIVCFLLITQLLLSAPSFSGSPVWKVTKGNQTLFIGGTFHLLTASDYPLPSAFEQAYTQANAIFLETDMRAMQSAENIGLMMQALMHPTGKTLEGSLKPATYTTLSTFLASRGMPIENFAPYTPTGVALSISLLELQKIGLRPELGVDQHFSNRADKDGKNIVGLETPSEHIAFLSALGKGKEDEFILKTLKDIEQMPTIMGELKKAWRTGDNKTLSTMATEEIKKDFPEVYATLLTNRNNAWMTKIEEMINSKPVEFVLVGAMHLAGQDGLLTQLKGRGYTIENL